LITAVLVVAAFAAGTKYGARVVVEAGAVLGRVYAHLRDEFRAIEDKIEKL
jgi:hypothetical protein